MLSVVSVVKVDVVSVVVPVVITMGALVVL